MFDSFFKIKISHKFIHHLCYHVWHCCAELTKRDILVCCDRRHKHFSKSIDGSPNSNTKNITILKEFVRLTNLATLLLASVDYVAHASPVENGNRLHG